MAKHADFIDSDISAANRVMAAWFNAMQDVTWDLLGDGVNPPTTRAILRTNIGAGTVGDAIFQAATSAAAITAIGNANLTALAALASTGFVAQTAAGTFADRTLTGSGLVTITNPAGIAGNPVITVPILQNYLTGLTMSTAGSSGTMTVAAGQAADSTNAALMGLNAAISKTTAAWAVGSGNGGLDTGAIANNTWYHFWEIMRPDTLVVDVLISLSATAPTMPTSYTLKRWIGAGKTNGSAQWVLFSQMGDEFLWTTPVLDVDQTAPGINAVLRVLPSVPTGVKVHALLNAITNNVTSNGFAVYISSPDQADVQASFTAAPLATQMGGIISGGATGAQIPQGWIKVRTDTSAQVRTRQTVSGVADTFKLATLGWVSTRGRDG